MEDHDLNPILGAYVTFDEAGNLVPRSDLANNTAEENMQYFTDTMISLQESMGVPKGGYPRGQNLLIIGGQQCGRSMLSAIPEIASRQVMVIQKQRTPDESGPGTYYAGSEFKLDDLPDVPSNADELLLHIQPRQMGKTTAHNALLQYESWKVEQQQWRRKLIKHLLRSKTKKGPKRKSSGTRK